MSYRRFKISDLSLTPATVATVATVERSEPPSGLESVANVATVAAPTHETEILPPQTVATVAEPIGHLEVSSAQTVATVATVAGGKPKSEMAEFASRPDPDALLSLLCETGPQSYGAAATMLRWTPTRTWQAEARLRAAGRITYDTIGRAIPIEGA